MKKLVNIIFAVFTAFAVLSCGGHVEVPETPQNQNENKDPDPDPDPGNSFGGDVTFTATIESLSDGSQPSWKKGESICIYDGENLVKTSNTEADGAVARFPATIKKGAGSVFAISPAVDDLHPSANGVNLEIPVEQTADSPTPVYRVAKSTNELLYFRNLFAVVKLSVSFEGVTSVAIRTGSDAALAGTVSVDYSGDTPVVAANSANVSLKGKFIPGEVYQLVVAPANLKGCVIEVYNEDKLVAHVDAGDVALAAGTIYEVPRIHPDMPVYQISNMWLWGGTGPEWNCTAVFDLFEKANLFNEQDGRGLNALKDNYLVFDSDGSFRNWAGEDARNWWFVLNGAYNLEGGVDLDLKEFYDVLPRSTATYTIDAESNVTFTLPDGTTRSAVLVPAGTYEMPGTTPPKSISISTQALRFDIPGTRDIWDDTMYTDYWRIAGHPRMLFIEIVQMPEGFVVPDAARTTDDAFEFIPPEYSFDWESLPGEWNVFGGNKEPFGLWVLGGSGSDPAFVSPVDKSWNWNDSIYNESDNSLTIAMTGTLDGKVTGTITWAAGEDGKFWDCIWVKTGADLSANFSPLPKGTSNVVVDMTTEEITIGESLKPSFLLPGVHAFAYNKRIEIPDKCFGLAFHLGEPIPVVESDHYQDVDRFVNAPLEYVMIFEKVR